MRRLLLAILLFGPLSAEAQRGRRLRRTATDEESVVVGSKTRTYVVRAPRGASRRGEPMPLVIVLHGGGGNAENAERMSGFSSLVERERLIVAYPNGSGRGALLTWNAVHCCGFAMESKVDDVSFIDAMIDAIAGEHAIDERRIYVTGMSNGGMMAHRLGREMRHRPAAIAPVVGAVFGDEGPPASAVSAIIFNGLLDKAVPANGGLGAGVGRNAWDGVPPRPNIDQGTYWARAGGCSQTPATRESPGVVLTTWECPSGRAVALHQVKEMGHAWPGGRAGRRGADDPGNMVDATEVMWSFFKAHSR